MKKILGTLSLIAAFAFTLAAIFGAPGATWWQYLAAAFLVLFTGAALLGTGQKETDRGSE